MARPFSEIRDELRSDPERAARMDCDKEALLRRYNRPWWKLVRLWDRITGRQQPSF